MPQTEQHASPRIALLSARQDLVLYALSLGRFRLAPSKLARHGWHRADGDWPPVIRVDTGISIASPQPRHDVNLT